MIMVRPHNIKAASVRCTTMVAAGMVLALMQILAPIQFLAQVQSIAFAETSFDNGPDSLVIRQNVALIKEKPPLINWKPETAPRAVLLCLHELGLYSGVFEDLGQKMARKGYDVYAMDLRGFGGWAEVKDEHARMDMGKILGDIREAVEALHAKNAGLPVFILGEAMGGALALKAAETFPELIQGTISSAPQGEHYKSAHNYLTVTHRIIAGGPNKRFEMGKELVSMATPRAELREAFENDPKVRLDLSPRELMDCQFFMYKTRNMARRITKTPVLIVQGDKDGESKPEGAVRVYDKLATADKRMMRLADGDHYVYEDTKVKDDALNGTLAWLNAHLSNSPGPQSSPE